ncbi:hypothetical protein F5Y08DRAFT_246148 [Xylaria arbuscula]|nr:hypothetical protein F5Y08DRAFT_246148 [Xylaria arbuscula]
MTKPPQDSQESQAPPPPPPPPLPNSLPKPLPPKSQRSPSSSTSEISQKRAKMAAQYGLADGPRIPYAPFFTAGTFKPCHMFFYGTLMDAEVLQHVTQCPTKPVLRPGSITGFELKMWAGSFPTLIPLQTIYDSSSSPLDLYSTGEAQPGQSGTLEKEVYARGDNAAVERNSKLDRKIYGVFCRVEKYQYFYKLQQYETSAYRGHPCRIRAEDINSTNKVENEEECDIEEGVVFVWAKNPHSPDLTDGVFDLVKWQNTHKAALFI